MLREIFAATFRDRVVHHLLYNHQEPIFEPKFIYQSYACRPDKGIHRSLSDLKTYLRKLTNNGRITAYALHLDIRGFFMHIDKHILFRLISAHINNPDIRWLTRVVIFNDPVRNFISKGDRSLLYKVPAHKSLFHAPPDKGLPIGNLTSQFFANVYLDQLDQFVKHSLKCRYYLRYVDDFILLSRDQECLRDWQKNIEVYLNQTLELTLNPQKERLHPVSEGVHWLGYVVRPEYVLVQRHIVSALRNRLHHFIQKLEEYSHRSVTPDGQFLLPFTEKLPPRPLLEGMLAIIHSYYGYFKHANSFRLRQSLWRNHFGQLKYYLEPQDKSLVSFRLRPGYIQNTKESREAF